MSNTKQTNTENQVSIQSLHTPSSSSHPRCQNNTCGQKMIIFQLTKNLQGKYSDRMSGLITSSYYPFSKSTKPQAKPLFLSPSNSEMDFQVVILAGGFSSNLAPLVSKVLLSLSSPSFIYKQSFSVANVPSLLYRKSLRRCSPQQTVRCYLTFSIFSRVVISRISSSYALYLAHNC